MLFFPQLIFAQYIDFKFNNITRDDGISAGGITCIGIGDFVEGKPFHTGAANDIDIALQRFTFNGRCDSRTLQAGNVRLSKE